MKWKLNRRTRKAWPRYKATKMRNAFASLRAAFALRWGSRPARLFDRHFIAWLRNQHFRIHWNTGTDDIVVEYRLPGSPWTVIHVLDVSRQGKFRTEDEVELTTDNTAPYGLLTTKYTGPLLKPVHLGTRLVDAIYTPNSGVWEVVEIKYSNTRMAVLARNTNDPDRIVPIPYWNMRELPPVKRLPIVFHPLWNTTA